MALDNPSYFVISSDLEVKRLLMPSANNLEMSDLNENKPCNLNKFNHELFIRENQLKEVYGDHEFSCKSNWNTRKNSCKTESESDFLHPEESVCIDDIFEVDNLRYYNLSNENFVNKRYSASSVINSETDDQHNSGLKSIIINNCSEKNTESFRHSSTTAILDDHLLRHGSYPRKRCNLCNKRSLTKNENMDDILIVSVKQSNAASLWVEYFISYFQQICKKTNRKPFKVLYIGADEFSDTDGDFLSLTERISSVKLQLIVVCPSMLDHIIKYPVVSSALGKLMIPDRTLALLLGVSDDDLKNIHKQILPTYFQWMRYRVGQDQDKNFTKEFLASAMAIFSKVWKQQSSVFSGEKSQFSVLPKKIKLGQNSLVVMLTSPLQRDDVVKVSVEKNNELIEIKTVKRRNPYTLKISIPELCTEVSTIINILVEKNGNIIGSRPVKCESRLKELEQILRSVDNPLSFMCQSLGLPTMDTTVLDTYFTESLRKKLPPNFNLCSDYFVSEKINSQRNFTRNEFPTLLHFAARYGLENLTKSLLDCPGSETALEIKSSSGMTPYDFAKNYYHYNLLHILKENDKANKKAELKLNLSFRESEDNINNVQMNDMELYKVCPPPRPVLSTLTESQALLESYGKRISAISFSSIEDIKTPSDVDEKKKIGLESFDLENLQTAVSSLDYSFLPPPKPVHREEDIDGAKMK